MGCSWEGQGRTEPWMDTWTPLLGCDDGHSMDGWMGMAACPVPLSPLPCCLWGWHPWLWAVMGQRRPLVGAAFAPRSVRLKLQREGNWEERREGQEGSSAEMLPDRHRVQTAAAGCRCNETQKYWDLLTETPACAVRTSLGAPRAAHCEPAAAPE